MRPVAVAISVRRAEAINLNFVRSITSLINDQSRRVRSIICVTVYRVSVYAVNSFIRKWNLDVQINDNLSDKSKMETRKQMRDTWPGHFGDFQVFDT